MMEEAESREGADRGQARVFGEALPQLDYRADARFLGQARIDLRLVRVVQHVHHVRSADAGWIVEAGVLEAARLQVGDAALGVLLHVLLGAEHDCLGRTGLGAGWALADRNAVGTERTLVSLMIDFGDARDVERTAFHAVATADTLLVIEVHDAV